MKKEKKETIEEEIERLKKELKKADKDFWVGESPAGKFCKLVFGESFKPIKGRKK